MKTIWRIAAISSLITVMRSAFSRQTAKAILIGLALLGFAAPVTAKLVHSSPSGFAITWSADVQANPQDIWAQLILPARWWNKAHSWSGDATNFSMTVLPGGCFCEKMRSGGFVEHARIIHATPDQMLVLSGALGPLQSEALTGTLTITIKPATYGKSVIKFDYVVGGYSRLPLQKIAPFVDIVIGEQQKRLITLIISGKPD